jgi:hypothetical protein
MTATGLKRPAPAFFAGVVLAGVTAAFAIGQARAQFVNPVPPTSPTFNTPTPNPVPPPPPVTPVSPAAPGGVQGSTVPGSQGAVPPITTAPQTASAPAAATPDLTRSHARNYGRAHEHRYGRHARSVRVLGPSYYPGLGLVYPPYVNPCHARPTWNVYYGEYLGYGCSW